MLDTHYSVMAEIDVSDLFYGEDEHPTKDLLYCESRCLFSGRGEYVMNLHVFHLDAWKALIASMKEFGCSSALVNRMTEARSNNCARALLHVGCVR